MMNTNKVNVYLDTNFLLIPGRFKIDIFTGIEQVVPRSVEFIVLTSTLRELEKIIESPSTKLTDRSAAKLALILIKQKSLKMIQGSAKGSVDEILLDMVREDDFVATQDRELKRLLREKGVTVLVLREKKRIVIER